MEFTNAFIPTSVLSSTRRAMEDFGEKVKHSKREQMAKIRFIPPAPGSVENQPVGGQGQRKKKVSPPPPTAQSDVSFYSSIFRNAKTPKKIIKSSFLENESIVVAVDATNERGGGLLRLSGAGDRKIFFYSVSLTRLFDFQGASIKFEMANALIALELFSPMIEEYLKGDQLTSQYQRVVFKTDNNFFLCQKGFDDPFDLQFFNTVSTKAGSLKAIFRQSLVSQGDVDMINCDHLSRDESLCHQLKTLEYEDNESCPYNLIDLSETAEQTILYEVREQIPAKYVLGYTNKYD
ncbi:unnamed protein product [Orchesella dallaii]|uniref:Uncharacterized protein n=1 Tax=Orchesella dallaii TaxID=48710 RepID=A0ABP1S9J3_9HEXA